jgi:hypothetical protein
MTAESSKTLLACTTESALFLFHGSALAFVPPASLQTLYHYLSEGFRTYVRA